MSLDNVRCMATCTLGGSLPEKLAAIAAAGFRSVELIDRDLRAWGQPASRLRNICDDLGLSVLAYQPFRDFEGCSRRDLASKLDEAERMFDVMAELRTDLTVLCGNVDDAASSEIDVIRDDLQMLSDRAAARSIRIGYEALSWSAWINNYLDVCKIVDLVDRDNFGIVIDTFHTLSRRDEISPISSVDPRKIFLVQVADAPYIPLDYLTWSRGHRCLPGTGEFDLAGMMAAILEGGYRGPISLEVFSRIYPSLPGDAVAKESYAALDRLLTESQALSRADALHLQE